MSKLGQADPVKLIMSLLSAEQQVLCEALQVLSVHFGRPDFISPSRPFDYTNYYEREMGKPLSRRLVSFDNPLPPEALPDVKGQTNRIEDQFSAEGRRKINIDPGYISQAHLILATGKGYTHRPYLRSGVYADLTLVFTKGTFRSLPWTYPDYGGAEMISILNRIRERYLVARNLN
jgi:hypothetical protein